MYHLLCRNDFYRNSPPGQRLGQPTELGHRGNGVCSRPRVHTPELAHGQLDGVATLNRLNPTKPGVLTYEINTDHKAQRRLLLHVGDTSEISNRKRKGRKRMAWHCNGITNQEMVSKLKSAGIIGSDKAEEAMLRIDRGKYCHESDPYLDRPRKIGYNVTISAPHMHAYALTMMSEHLSREGARALDVGSGSGYLTACMAHMMGPGGIVVGLEHIPELVESSIKHVEQDRPDLVRNGRIKFIVGDGRLGHDADGPYDVIHVGAAADSLPKSLVNQLAPGGRLLCPVVAVQEFQRYQDFLQVDKNLDGTLTTKKLMQVTYVPLTDAKAQLANFN